VKAVLLLGPTASGKTGLAAALAARFPFEIVSVDSAQVYRGMDIGTAKPDAATRARVPHHLIDIADPTEPYSAGRFRADALRAMEHVAARGKVPLLAGGTMLYFRALTTGLAELPPAEPAIRRDIEERARREGWPALHRALAAVDAATASRLEPTDAQRIQRALEVHRATGRPLSAFHAASAPPALPFDALAMTLEPSDRAALHERIAERFRAMLAAGFVAEVEALRGRYALRESLPAMRAVGYRQVWQTLEGRESEATLEARGIAATRQLAKRQLTWLRAGSGPFGGAIAPHAIERYDCLRPDLERAALERVARFLEPTRRCGT
jgi:tRNA dimethylallyltransferase